MVFANLSSNPSQLAQIKSQTRNLPYPPHQPGHQTYPLPYHLPPQQSKDMTPLPPISSVRTNSRILQAWKSGNMKVYHFVLKTFLIWKGTLCTQFILNTLYRCYLRTTYQYRPKILSVQMYLKSKKKQWINYSSYLLYGQNTLYY